ncbi:MAG TPA: SGNH/GDSL hydrolase family protein [Candidatus Krumholzibacteria bacterium]|nr:SGNH/GDSL hydrolase family protein [Candidatus Krumholzibacteria bacterium]
MTTSRNPAQLLLAVAGVVLATGAVIHNPWTVRLAARAATALVGRVVAVPDPSLIQRAQLAYLLAGAIVLLAAFLIGRAAALDRCFRHPLTQKLTLALVVLMLPLVWLEIGLRPFVPPVEKSNRLFVRDDDLGWRLRPGAVDQWGGVTVRVNERGFRGPVIPYPRAPGTRRILYLGDSVTFGYRMERWEDTWPFLLADTLAARDSFPIETVNLSVEGYSQWQENMVLTREGYRYQPDLVVVGFVLNDVTEMFHLPRFGGSDEAYQLRHAYASRADRLLSKSALFYELQNVIREVKARRRLGADVRLGAIQQENLEVESLMRNPDEPAVRTAWDLALADLQHIVDGCRARGIPVLVVVFPFTVQLDDPAALSAPQRVIDAYANARGIPAVDLLPLLVDHMRSEGMRAGDLFLDHDHLSEAGHRVVAGLVADAVAHSLAGAATD